MNWKIFDLSSDQTCHSASKPYDTHDHYTKRGDRSVLEPGQKTEITYPDSNLVNVLATMKRRQIHVHTVRDLISDPLTPIEYFRRPLIRRSRWLIKAWDERLELWRQFYLGATREYHSPGELRIALYEPGATKPYRIVSRGFSETPRDRIQLAKTVRELHRMDLADLQIKIIADDLRIYRT